MQKILGKRVIREFKENILRYLALGMLIILGMYLIVSLIAAAETIIDGTAKRAQKNKLEDGEFSVFVPLTAQEKEEVTSDGITLESMYYLDFAVGKNSVLRVFKNRKNINQTDLDVGRLAVKNNEVVLEKRYCEEHALHIGDKVKIADEIYRIVGIGSAPDYEAMYQNLSDSAVESRQFGLAFVNNVAYDRLKISGKSKKSEEYQYAYLLNGSMTNDKLKEKLKAFDFSADDVNDPYFRNYWKKTVGKKKELENGIEKLVNGSGKLTSALKKLDRNRDNVKGGTEKIMKAYLQEANDSLKKYGLSKTLTEDNFEQVLGKFKDKSRNGILKLELDSVIEKLKELKAYQLGMKEYTNGVRRTAKGSDSLFQGLSKLQDHSDQLMDTYFKVNTSNLTSFLTAEENPRIGAAADDQVINKIGGLVAGVIIMILFTYVISVFVIHGIEKESSIIGTLYALGVRKKDLMIHYLTLPVAVTFLAGLIGTVLGFSKWGVTYQMQDCYGYYSIPDLPVVYPLYLILYGLVMPSVVALIVNCAVIRKRLSRPVLALIRNEQKSGKVSNINLRNMGFIGTFRIRQMLREARTGFTVVFGMFISLLIVMLGINCFVGCRYISIENKADTKYEYMYTYKYPEKSSPKGGEACFAKTLKKEIYGYNLEVTLLGIDRDNPYFPFNVKKGKNCVAISSAMARKYHLKKGDQVVLWDEEEGMEYAFTIDKITQYSVGLYAFMDIDSMRELFGKSEDYYNVVFSDHVLDIDAGRLYATTTKEEIRKASDVFSSMMMPMVTMMCGVSALIFCTVMYLMMKVMIDRSAFGISLIKIFGYRTGEIRKLYLDGNFYIVAVGAAICIPLAKLLMDTMYPLMVSNVACGMNLKFGWWLYLGIYLAVILLYLVINQFLVRRLKKMVPAEVLKNRE